MQTDGKQSQFVNVVLVNLNGIFVDLLRSAFASSEKVQMTGFAANAKELTAMLDEGCPDVALVGTQGLAREATTLPLLQQIASAAPTVRSIVISSEMDREDVVTLFRHGARGLICGSAADLSLLIKCIQCVAAGQI